MIRCLKQFLQFINPFIPKSVMVATRSEINYLTGWLLTGALWCLYAGSFIPAVLMMVTGFLFLIDDKRLGRLTFPLLGIAFVLGNLVFADLVAGDLIVSAVILGWAGITFWLRRLPILVAEWTLTDDTELIVDSVRHQHVYIWSDGRYTTGPEYKPVPHLQVILSTLTTYTLNCILVKIHQEMIIRPGEMKVATPFRIIITGTEMTTEEAIPMELVQPAGFQDSSNESSDHEWN